MSLVVYVPGTRAWKMRREAELCRQTTERVQEIVDGEIGPARAEQVLKRHLEACRSCNAEGQVIRELKVAIARVSSEADPTTVRNLEDLARRLCEGRERQE
jgi:anti-sigma factor RsiW